MKTLETDRLILRLASYEEDAAGFPVAPLEPLEELYYALAALKDTVPAWKTTMLLTTTGTAWRGQGVGRALLQALSQRLKAKGAKKLMVSSLNPVNLSWRVPGTPGGSAGPGH